MEKTRPRIELTPAAIQQGYKSCRTQTRTFFAQYAWIASNLTGDRRKGLDTLMHHLTGCLDLTDLASPDRLPLAIWSEIRDDLSDAFLDQCTSTELAALVDTVRKFNVPKQYLFDMLDGVDIWIRNREFESFDELLVFAYRVGGAALTAAVPIVEFEQPDYDIPAVKAGQAIFLTQLIVNLVDNVKLNKVFIAQEDLEETGVNLDRLKLRQPSKELRYLVRLYTSRIEKLFYEGGPLIQFLEFDGRRSITSLLAIHWKMLLKMQLEPESVLDPAGVLSKREWFGLKTRHVLGTEGNIPIIPDLHDRDHH